MDKGLELVWFDWKQVDAMIDFIEKVTETGPMCFRQVDTGEDSYVLVLSKGPVSQQAAETFYQQTIESK